jgi:hypothetical protein
MLRADHLRRNDPPLGIKRSRIEARPRVLVGCAALVSSDTIAPQSNYDGITSVWYQPLGDRGLPTAVLEIDKGLLARPNGRQSRRIKDPTEPAMKI